MPRKIQIELAVVDVGRTGFLVEDDFEARRAVLALMYALQPEAANDVADEAVKALALEHVVSHSYQPRTKRFTIRLEKV